MQWPLSEEEVRLTADESLQKKAEGEAVTEPITGSDDCDALPEPGSDGRGAGDRDAVHESLEATSRMPG